MAKRKVRASKNGHGPVSAESMRTYVELMNGGKLYLLPVTEERLALIDHGVKAEFEKSDNYRPQPYYHPNNDENTQPIYWDAESVAQDGTTEEKEAWLEYEASLETLSGLQYQARIKTCLIEGTSLFVTRKGAELDLEIDEITGEFAAPQHWLKRQQALGVELPTDPYELKHHFLTPLVSDIKTQQEIVLRCNTLALQGIATEEDVNAYMDAVFQRAMDNQRARFRGIIDRQIRGIAEVSGLELQPEIDGATSGEALGASAE